MTLCVGGPLDGDSIPKTVPSFRFPMVREKRAALYEQKKVKGVEVYKFMKWVDLRL